MADEVVATPAAIPEVVEEVPEAQTTQEGSGSEVESEGTGQALVTVCFSMRTPLRLMLSFSSSQQLEPRSGGVQLASFQDAAAFVVEKEASIPMQLLVFDLKKQHGQIRKLTSSVVNYYYQTLLTKGAPPQPVTVPLKRLAGMPPVPPCDTPSHLFSFPFLQMTSSCPLEDSTSVRRWCS